MLAMLMCIATGCSHMQGCMCRGSCSSLHYDPYQNLLCVVRGRKRVHLFPPSCGPALSPRPVWGESPNHSPVNSFEPDFAQHAGLAGAMRDCIICDLKVCFARARVLIGWCAGLASDDGRGQVLVTCTNIPACERMHRALGNCIPPYVVYPCAICMGLHVPH